MLRITRSCFTILALLVGFSSAQAQLVLNIDSSTETFWFSGSDTGTPTPGGAESPQVFWRLGSLTGTSGVVTAAAGVDTANNVGVQVYDNGDSNYGYNIQMTFPTDSEQTISGNSVSFSYASQTAAFKTGLNALAGSSIPRFTGSGFSAIQVSAVPEPSSFAALAGLFALGTVALRRRPRTQPL